MKTFNDQHTLLLFSSPWQRLSFFYGLSPNLVHQLLEGASFAATRSKEILFRQDDPADSFGFVVEGTVRLFRKNPKGHRIVMDFVAPGGMIGGLLMAQTEATYPVTAQAVGPGQFLKIPQSTYKKYWMNHPEVIARTQNANMERMQAIHSTRELQKYPLEEKILQLLLRLSPMVNSEILVNISRTDLSDMIGASVESVIRIFSGWEKEGFVRKTDDGHEAILKSKLLERTHA